MSDRAKIEAIGPKSLPTRADALFGRHDVAIARDEEGWEVPVEGPDSAIRFELPVLLFMIRHADVGQPDQVAALRKLAATLIRTRSEIHATPLAQLVNEANAAFGELTGLLMSEHRELTYPDWTNL